MESADLLGDAFGRVREVVHEVVDGLTPDQLTFRITFMRGVVGRR